MHLSIHYLLFKGIRYAFFLCIPIMLYSQDEVDNLFSQEDTASTSSKPIWIPNETVDSLIRSKQITAGEIIIGGSVNSIFHESVDSSRIVIAIDGKNFQEVYSRNGIFYISTPMKKGVVDISVSHPDFHSFDTTLLISDDNYNIVHLALEPMYKVLLRGRVYAGNMPLEGVNVEIIHAGETFRMQTLGCYYDNDNYWNCLYNGMFKSNITTDNPDDSITIRLSKTGMKPLSHSLTIHDYQGEIMALKMSYDAKLPTIHSNNLNLKLGFPFMSTNSDWYMNLSYYRLMGKHALRRLAIGLEGNMYISNITVEHTTFPNLENSKADSSYLDAFIGPSILLWILSPEKRYFSTYTGVTGGLSFESMKLVPQFFLGTRIFLDMNKAINLELRYARFNRDIVHYNFNPYGTADRFIVSDELVKLQANVGIQIVF